MKSFFFLDLGNCALFMRIVLSKEKLICWNSKPDYFALAKLLVYTFRCIDRERSQHSI